MDYNAKMEELEVLWQDSFDLCKAMIDACKAGDMKLNASLLKELNGFIKQSVDFLKYREAETAFEKEDEQEEEETLVGLPSFDGDSGGDGQLAGDEFKLPDDLPTFTE
ncbi:hypothetical protein [uncultured Desulfosarcina sp.]|uniref:hypothetical protein n=1 Tax=uncultured Desulfosarcina sp. TaxID=218289 RepID=UPI0029C8DE22|nr:hypothetical protein [uncultured Desulfosarcina sp.]